MKPSIKCCDVFIKMADRFNWMRYEKDGKYVRVMPHIPKSNTITGSIIKHNHRVNFCPSCGKDIRDIELND